MALCSYTDVETIVQIDLSTSLQTSLTNSIIPFADATIKTYFGYDIEVGNQTEVIFGDNNREIQLKHLPVNSITSITEDDNVLTEGNEEDFVFHENGRLERVLKRWSGSRPRNITVVYNAGYSTIPDDIRFTSARVSARILMSALNLSSQSKTGAVESHLTDNTNGAGMSVVTQERIGDLDVTLVDPLAYFDGPILKESDKMLLNTHKKQIFV